eukprot:339690_1
MFSLLCCALMIGLTFGHMCMVSPYQRGGVVSDINTIEAPECDNSNYNNGTSPGKSPCYHEDKSDERIAQFIGRGAEQIFVMQKNHDHFNKSNPGNFTWNLWGYNTATGTYSFEKMLGSIPDTQTNGAQAFYQITAHVPSVEEEHYVVQGIYYTNNYYN